MTEKLLRDVLKEAQEKEQIGLLIWPFWRIWDDIGYELKPGDKDYDFALSQVTKCEESTIVVQSGFLISHLIAVPVKKLVESDEFFNYVLKVCEQYRIEGPITLLPLNELSDCC